MKTPYWDLLLNARHVTKFQQCIVEVRTIIIVLMLIGKGGMERVTLRGQEK